MVSSRVRSLTLCSSCQNLKNVRMEKLHTKTINGRTGEMKMLWFRNVQTEACQTPTPMTPRRSELQPAPVHARINAEINPNTNTPKDSRPAAHRGREMKSFLRILSTTVA